MHMTLLMLYIAAFAGAYLIGSFPSAYLVTRLRFGADIRYKGSGNVGALNTYRSTHNIYLAVVVLLLDLVKGAVTAWIPAHYTQPDLTLYILAGNGVVLGHCYPVWLRFKGGRGLAAGAGFFLVTAPLVPLIWAGIWLIYFVLIRKHIVANLIATFLLPLIIFFINGSLFKEDILPVILSMMFIVFLKHLERLPDVIFGNPYDKKE